MLLAGEILQGLSGGFGLLFAVCISYLTDATSLKQRTFRIVVAEMMTFLIGGLNQVGEGYLIKISYLPTLGIALGSGVVVLFYITMPSILIETVDRSSLNYKEFREVFWRMKKLLEFNENGRRWQMLLLDLFIFFCVSQFFAISAIFVLYGTAKPFCWTSSIAGIATALSWVSASVGEYYTSRQYTSPF